MLIQEGAYSRGRLIKGGTYCKFAKLKRSKYRMSSIKHRVIRLLGIGVYGKSIAMMILNCFLYVPIIMFPVCTYNYVSGMYLQLSFLYVPIIMFPLFFLH